MTRPNLFVLGLALVAAAAVLPLERGREDAVAGRPYALVITQMARDGTNPTAQGSFATSATATVGGAVTVRATVRSSDALFALVDVEVLGPNDVRVAQEYFDNTAFGRAQSQSFEIRWTAPSAALRGEYVIKVGVFEPGQYWGALYHWNDRAGAFVLQ